MKRYAHQFLDKPTSDLPTRVVGLQNEMRSLCGQRGIVVEPTNASVPGNLRVAFTPAWAQSLAAVMPSTVVTTNSAVVRLPYTTSGDANTLVPAGTLVIMTAQSSLLTLDGTVATKGLQWFVVNGNATSTATVVGGNGGAVVYGVHVIPSGYGVLVRQLNEGSFVVFGVLNINGLNVTNVSTWVSSTVTTTPTGQTMELSASVARNTTVLLTVPPASISLIPDVLAVGYEWFVVNCTSTVATLTMGVRDVLVAGVTTTVTATATGNNAIPSGSVVLVRQYAVGTFLVIGSLESADVAYLLTAVLDGSTATNQGLLELPGNASADCGSTTIMNGPSGEVQLHATTREPSTEVGHWWHVVNRTPRDIPINAVIKSSAAPAVYGHTYIPNGRGAVIRHHSTSEFTVMVTHTEDLLPQSIIHNYRVQESTAPSIVYVPWNPNDATGPRLQPGSLVHITQPNTEVRLILASNTRGTYHFLNESNSPVTVTGCNRHKTPSLVTGTSFVAGDALSTTTVDATIAYFVVARTYDLSTYLLYAGNEISLPYDPYLVNSGIPDKQSNAVPPTDVLCGYGANKSVTFQNLALSTFLVPTGSARDRAYYVRNVGTAAVDVSWSQINPPQTVATSVPAGGAVYVKLIADYTWAIQTAVLHFPAASQDEDPLPNGAIVNLPTTTVVRLYSDSRTVGRQWYVINESTTTNSTVVPSVSGLGAAAPTLTGNSTIMAGQTVILRQRSTTEYVLIAPEKPQRTIRRITTVSTALDGTYTNQFCMFTTSGATLTVTLSTTYMVDGAEIDLFNKTTNDINIGSSVVPILSTTTSNILPSMCGATVKYSASIPGFSLVGGIV